MQQILVNIAAVAAALYLARLFYRSFTASRRSEKAGCNSCGSCGAAQKEAPAGQGISPTDVHR